MTLKPGKRLGPYEITGALGAGGMGEVYRATDTRLTRSVAVKVLPEHLASDPERRKRFELEAKAVSSLNHPHICTLHDVGEQDGIHYLVMELVEGETLEFRLSKGALALDKALEYAIQIADALEKAHRSGVVHRDLKPANIMLTTSGVKLLDFGLAKLKDETPPLSGLSQAPTLDKAVTQQGTIVGTLRYMAPEQLEGERVDARTDIFSFGSVLYEMLGGKRAFEGSSSAAVMAAILTANPFPLKARQPISPALQHLIRLCLAKKPNERWQTAHDVARQLEWLRESRAAEFQTTTISKSKSSTRLVAVAAFLIVVVLILAYVFRSPAPSQADILTVGLPEDVRFTVGEDFLRSAAISPDSQRIVFTGLELATGKALLYVRPRDSDKATPLPGTEDANSVFWSPDSSAVGFFANGKLQTVSLNGGPPRTIATAKSNGGATWNEDGLILASLDNPGPIVMIPPNGDKPTPVTSLDPSMEVDHDWPQFLDDGQHFLYMSWGRTTAENKIFVGLLGSESRSLLLEGKPALAYAAPNHVLFLENGTLVAQQFDTGRFQLIGQPVPLAENARPPFSASRTGAIAYRTISATPNPLLWIRPDGTVIAPVLPPGYYKDPVISPDGTEVAFASQESPNAPFQISILNLSTGMPRRLTVGDASNRAPLWSPDGKAIAYLSLRRDAPGLYLKNANGVGMERRLMRSPGVLWPYQWRGSNIIYFAGTSGANDVLMMSPDKPDVQTPLVQSPFNDVDGALSPNGEWFAFSSNETGRWEIYVTTWPTSSTKLPVTTHGGTDPNWSRDGKTLYFIKPATAEMMAVPVALGNPPEFGPPRRIHPGPFEYPSAHSFDVDPRKDNDRILVAPSFAPLGNITLILNWQSLSKN